MIHEQGLVITELNSKKGIWCKVCRADCQATHLITFKSKRAGTDLIYEHICPQCAKDLIACLQKSLMDALLTEKETS